VSGGGEENADLCNKGNAAAAMANVVGKHFPAMRCRQVLVQHRVIADQARVAGLIQDSQEIDGNGHFSFGGSRLKQRYKVNGVTHGGSSDI
jgi:hypothetical protein